jgi:hypothetical protein
VVTSSARRRSVAGLAMTPGLLLVLALFALLLVGRGVRR